MVGVTESNGRDGADEANADASRKWFGIQLPPRDRDIGPPPERVERIMAFLQARGGSYDRGELVVGRPVSNRMVWQPFPQGSPTIYAGPFRLNDAGDEVRGRDAVRVVELQTKDRRLQLRILPPDLDRLRQALQEQGR
jgi:hypothetical protein